MIRNNGLLTAVISSMLAATVLPACSMQMSAHSGNEPPKAAPPPAAPTPAPAPAPAPAPVAKAPPPTPVMPSAATVKAPSKVVEKGGGLTMPGNIVFDTDSANFTPGSGSEAVLDDLKQFMDENKSRIAVIRIEGHTDNQGEAAHNLELSGQRALTVKKYLVAHGVDPTRLIAVGFGQTKPLAPNSTDAGRAKNRRTEFHIAKTFNKQGKAVNYLGGKPTGGGTEFK